MAANERMINEENFLRLQAHAVAFVDTPNTVLARMIDHFEATTPSKGTAFTPAVLLATRAGTGRWPSIKFPRGGELPIGLEMHGKYKNKPAKAHVTENGIVFENNTYPDPTSAAKAAKRWIAPEGDVPPTNGWNFWHYMPVSATGRSKKPIDSFRNFPEQAMDEFGRIQMHENLGSPDDAE